MERKHIVKSYDQELALLKEKLLEMGSIAEKQLDRIVQAMNDFDGRNDDAIIADDRLLDDLLADVDSLTVRMLAKRQPMAADLRSIISSLKIAASLERTGDYTVNIIRHLERLGDQRGAVPTAPIHEMALVARSMLHDAMDAYRWEDSDKASVVYERDDQIDTVYANLLEALGRMPGEENENASVSTTLLMIARCCERIGDHIANFADSVYYIIEGKFLK